jgi:hypothetical protein
LTPARPSIKVTGVAKLLARFLKLITPKRRWAQFSLATMFVVLTVLCVGLALVVVPAERQRRAVAAIEAVGGRVGYFGLDQKASAAFPRPFLRRWLSRDYFDEVEWVDLAGTKVTDTELAVVQVLTGLVGLTLDGTQVTDAGLSRLDGLKGLKKLWLFRNEFTQVSDAGLAQLRQRLPNCRIQSVRGDDTAADPRP